MEKGKQESIYRPYIGDYIEHMFQEETHYFLPQDLIKVIFFFLAGGWSCYTQRLTCFTWQEKTSVRRDFTIPLRILRSSEMKRI